MGSTLFADQTEGLPQSLSYGTPAQPMHHHCLQSQSSPAQFPQNLSQRWSTSSHQPPPTFICQPTTAYLSLLPSSLKLLLELLLAEVIQAGRPSAQRRTEALAQLNFKETGFKNEDLAKIVAEFELNSATCDTYWALKRGRLRRLWLSSLVKRRRRF